MSIVRDVHVDVEGECHGMSCMRDNLVEDGFVNFVEDNSEFELRDYDEEKDPEFRAETKRQAAQREASERRATRNCVDAAFAAAATLGSSDYAFMKGVEFDDVPKRKSFHVTVETLTENVCYYAPTENEEGVLVGFTMEWLRSVAEVQGIDHRQILVAMSDGSLSSDRYGGCGYFAALLSFAEQLSFPERHGRSSLCFLAQAVHNDVIRGYADSHVI